MPTLRLWDVQSLVLIVHRPGTNLIWTNQAGGTHCAHPQLEGFLVPLPGFDPPEPDPLYDRWGIVDDWRDEARTFLREAGLADWLDVGHPSERCGEAWVPVAARSTVNRQELADRCVLLFDAFDALDLHGGALTYENSD